MAYRSQEDDPKDTDGTSGYVSAHGVRLYYRIDGRQDAPPVVFSNSLGTDLRMWEPQVGAFAARFRVIRYDSRGHGRSDVPPGPYTLDTLARDVLTLLDALAIERAHLCGLSLGGMGALWVAIHHPERVLRAVFANTAARIGTEATWSERIKVVREGGMGAVRDGVVARFLSAAFRARYPEMTAEIAEMLETTSPQGYIAACEALRDADLRTDVTSIRVPSLILSGALDEATPPGQARELHAAITASDVLTLDDAAHLSNIEQAAAFNAAVAGFLGNS